LPGTRLLVVERHTVLYVVRDDGDVVVARVFGPYRARGSETEYDS